MEEDLGHAHLISDRVSTISFDSLHDESSFLLREESVFVGEIDDEEEAEDGEEDREDTEENEDPLPAGESSLSTEQRHSI